MTMTDEAADLAAAMAAHQAGRLDEADRAYRAVLALEPDQPDALHFRGVLSFQRREPEEGIGLVRRSLEIEPGNAHAWNNLGNMLQVRERRPEAVEAYKNAVTLIPDLPETWYNLGVLYRVQEDYAESIAHLERAIALKPDMRRAHEGLGMLNYALGQFDAARRAYQRWLAAIPDDPIAQHMARATDPGQGVPERADDDYVKQTFDGFADNFDEKLSDLGYQAPALVTALVQNQPEYQSGRAIVLDAGCGTGLCGPLLRSSAHRLVGIDLSSGMLEKARERGCYDELIEGELVAAMRGLPGTFDVIVSADVFVYFGALDEAFAAAFGALRPGGAFAFTVEAWLDWDAAAGFQIDPSGRYRHDRDYLERAARAVGFDVIDIRSGVLRHERRQEVLGWAALMRRPVG